MHASSRNLLVGAGSANSGPPSGACRCPACPHPPHACRPSSPTPSPGWRLATLRCGTTAWWPWRLTSPCCRRSSCRVGGCELDGCPCAQADMAIAPASRLQLPHHCRHLGCPQPHAHANRLVKNNVHQAGRASLGFGCPAQSRTEPGAKSPRAGHYGTAFRRTDTNLRSGRSLASICEDWGQKRALALRFSFRPAAAQPVLAKSLRPSECPAAHGARIRCCSSRRRRP